MIADVNDESFDADVRAGVNGTREKPVIYAQGYRYGLEQWRVQDTERTMLAGSIWMLTVAHSNSTQTDDEERIEELLTNAPNARGRESMQSLINSQRQFRNRQGYRIRNGLPPDRDATSRIDWSPRVCRRRRWLTRIRETNAT